MGLPSSKTCFCICRTELQFAILMSFTFPPYFQSSKRTMCEYSRQQEFASTSQHVIQQKTQWIRKHDTEQNVMQFQPLMLCLCNRVKKRQGTRTVLHHCTFPVCPHCVTLTAGIGRSSCHFEGNKVSFPFKDVIPT